MKDRTKVDISTALTTLLAKKAIAFQKFMLKNLEIFFMNQSGNREYVG